MYLPKNKYKIKSTAGGDVVNSDGTPYVGSYIETAKGTVYEGNNLNGKKQVLAVRNQTQSNEIERPYNDYYGPTEKDYQNGSYIRYFTRNHRGKFVEMNKEQWLEKRNQKRLTSGQVTWLLTGPVKDGKVNGYPFKGTETKNRETLQKLERTYPGISDFFKSPSEFVR